MGCWFLSRRTCLPRMKDRTAQPQPVNTWCASTAKHVISSSWRSPVWREQIGFYVTKPWARPAVNWVVILNVSSLQVKQHYRRQPPVKLNAKLCSSLKTASDGSRGQQKSSQIKAKLFFFFVLGFKRSILPALYFAVTCQPPNHGARRWPAAKYLGICCQITLPPSLCGRIHVPCSPLSFQFPHTQNFRNANFSWGTKEILTDADDSKSRTLRGNKQRTINFSPSSLLRSIGCCYICSSKCLLRAPLII